MFKDGKCEPIMMVLWKILCISCYTGEFADDSERLLSIIGGTEEWMAERRNKGDEGIVGLLLGKSVAGVKEKVLVWISRVVMGNVLKWWERRKYLMFGT